jgi:hypothetical protein
MIVHEFVCADCETVVLTLFEAERRLCHVCELLRGLKVESTPEQVTALRAILSRAQWSDGRHAPCPWD